MSEAKHKPEKQPEIIRFPVFRDDKGNRFVFPGLYQGGTNGQSGTDIWARCLHIKIALNVEQEKETLNVPLDADGFLTFPHVPADASSRGFAHGSSKVWIVGGPEFEAIAKAEGRQP
jgi:hypothetical protein